MVFNKKIIKDEKIGFARCSKCFKFCQGGGIEKMIKTAEKFKKEGFETIVFVCDTGSEKINQFIANKEINLVLDIIKIGVRDNKGKVKLIKKIR